MIDISAFYLVLGLGISHYDSIPNDPAKDNTRFCDQGFLCNSKAVGDAFTAGIGYQFGPHWATEVALSRTGSFKLQSQFPADSSYSVAQHKCLSKCSELYTFNGEWRATGVSMSALGSYPVGNFSPYAKAGLSAYQFGGQANFTTPQGETIDCYVSCKVSSWRAGPLYGLGVSYTGKVSPYIEITQQRTVGQGYPGFTNWTQAVLGARIRF